METNDPIDQLIDAMSITARPSAVEPAPRPGATTSPRPTSPVSALSCVARAGCSRPIVRMTMICSGTVPTMIAATLESIRVSATCTRPTPSVRRRRTDDRGAAELAAADAEARPAQGEDRGQKRACDEEAASAGEQRWQRLDGDLDPEVRRAPEDVDDEQRRPDVSDGSRHLCDNEWQPASTPPRGFQPTARVERQRLSRGGTARSGRVAA